MTRVFITIDTEYSSGLVRDLSDADREDNFARSIACITPDGLKLLKAAVPNLGWIFLSKQGAICSTFPMTINARSLNMRAIHWWPRALPVQLPLEPGIMGQTIKHFRLLAAWASDMTAVIALASQAVRAAFL